MLRFILLLATSISFIFFSCKRENNCDCFKSTGSNKTEIRSLGDFNEIELENNINLTLTQDTLNYAEVEAGEHLLKLIKTEINGNVLNIRNDNKCNWVRSYKKEINIHLHFKSLEKLINRGSGNISSTDTIRSPVIYIENWDGSGIINLTIKSQESYIKEHIGPADFFIKGRTGFNYVWSAGYGKMDLSKLLSYDAVVISHGTNDTWVNADKSIKAEIYYNGNIYYTGNANDIKGKIEGTGRLMKF